MPVSRIMVDIHAAGLTKRRAALPGRTSSRSNGTAVAQVSEAPAPDNIKDPSIPPDGPSLLLQLPRELKDMIYEYALTNDHGLVEEASSAAINTRTRFRILDSHSRQSTHPNPLKEVCRETYYATRGLAIKFNDLTWRGNTPSAAVLHFERFLQQCAPFRKDWIKRIIFTFGSWPSLNLAFHFGPSTPPYDFCIQHPNAVVIVRLDCCIPFLSKIDYVYWVNAFHYVLRGSFPLPMLLGRDLLYEDCVLEWCGFQRPANLRFTCSTTFGERSQYVIRELLSGYYGFGDTVADAILQVMRALHKDGL